MSATSEKYVALYSVLVDGQEIDQRARPPRPRGSRSQLPSAARRVHALCRFPKGEPGQPEPIDEHPFEIGKQLEIRLGAREDRDHHDASFKGEIVTLEPNFGAGSVELLVRGFDRSHVLLRSRNVRTFQNQTSSDIVSQDRPGGRLPGRLRLRAASRTTSSSRTTRPTGTSSGAWPSESASSSWSRTRPHTSASRHRTGRSSSSGRPRCVRSNPRVTAIQQVKQVTLLAQDPKTKQAIDVTVSDPNQIAQIGVDRATVAGAFDGGHAHIATEPVKCAAGGKGGSRRPCLTSSPTATSPPRV